MKGSIWDIPTTTLFVFLMFFSIFISAILVFEATKQSSTIFQQTYLDMANDEKNPQTKEIYLNASQNAVTDANIVISAIKIADKSIPIAIVCLILYVMYLTSSMKFDMKTFVIVFVLFVIFNLFALVLDLFFGQYLELTQQYVDLMATTIHFLYLPSAFLFFVGIILFFVMLIKEDFWKFIRYR